MSKLAVTLDGRTFEVEIHHIPADGSTFHVVVDGEVLDVTIPQADQQSQMDWMLVDGHPYEIVLGNDLNWISSRSGRHTLEIRDMDMPVSRPLSGDGRVKAPIPGIISKMLVSVGDEVSIGQPLLVLEAMKMENEILAPCSGFVSDVRVGEGHTVGMGDLLVEIN